jgi:predicted dehydrogenase
VKTIKIGILGCARIVKDAIIAPAAEIGTVDIAHIGARDAERARAYAAEHGIARHSAGYEDVIADPDIDLIYNPLPNSLHAEWTMKALRAGKAVLCEKPLTANAAEAEAVAAVARETGSILIEAFHYRYHPLAVRLSELIRSGAIGKLLTYHIDFLVPEAMIPESDIRFSYRLAGGAAMDPGCYCVDLGQMVTGEEARVTSAHAELLAPEIDYDMRAELSYPSGVTGSFHASLRDKRDDLNLSLKVVGSRGTIEVRNPFVPQFGHKLILAIDGRLTEESFDLKTTYWYQLNEVLRILREGGAIRTNAENGVVNMRTIDAIYVAAGLSPRGLAA